MPTQESQKFRDQLRSGKTDCRCPRTLDNMGEHVPNCYWSYCLNKIYELEREQEGIT